MGFVITVQHLDGYIETFRRLLRSDALIVVRDHLDDSDVVSVTVTKEA